MPEAAAKWHELCPKGAVPEDGGAVGPDVQSGAPAQQADNTTSCSATVPPLSLTLTDSEGKPQRTALGHFVAGNTESRKHGQYGRVSAALIEERERFERLSLTDDGGAQVPVRRAARHGYRARLDVQIKALSDALEHFGLFDRRNHLRVAWLQQLTSLISTAQRLDASLGDDTQLRSVGSGLSADQWAARARAARTESETNQGETK